MSETWLAESYSSTSRRHAAVVHDLDSAWLYLHAPSDDPETTAGVDSAAFLFNLVDTIHVSEVKNYKGGPPPIATPYALPQAVVVEPARYEWGLVWSDDGESILATQDDVAWCFVTPENGNGFCRAIAKSGPWGEPWNQDVFDSINWLRE